MMDTYRPNTHKAKQATPALVRCHRCSGTGFAPCRICGGAGKSMAGADLNGHPVFTRCEGCLGRRTSRCPQCHGQLFI